VTAYQAPGDAARTGDVPARICFWEAPLDTGKFCTTFRRAFTNSDDKPQVFQTIDNLSIVHLTEGLRPVLAVHLSVGMFYGGSGTLEQTDLWTYQPAAEEFECIATLSTTNNGEVRILDHGPLAEHIVTADFVWNFAEGETHYEPHRYQMTVRRFDGASGFYDDILHYVTRNKYPSTADSPSNEADVVEHELPNIQRFLKLIYPTTR
jgi:hypothetical protein